MKYLFTSKRLGFRLWTDNDVKAFYELNSDPEVMKYFPKTLSFKEARSLIEKMMDHYSRKGFTYYAVDVLETSDLIGMIGLAYQEYDSEFTPCVDIGWRLKREAWGQGFATEGAMKCLEYGFQELGLEKIIAVCSDTNFRSENVMQKIGMKKIGAFDHPELLQYPKLKHHICYEAST